MPWLLSQDAVAVRGYSSGTDIIDGPVLPCCKNNKQTNKIKDNCNITVLILGNIWNPNIITFKILP